MTASASRSKVAARSVAPSRATAPAAHATITLRVHDNLLRVTVADDGPGGADDRAGTGLRGITDRVAATGGRLTITSDPGRGTSITAELPMRGQVDVQR